MPLEALENLSAWVEANPDKVAMGVTTLMGAMDRNAEDRGAPSKDSKAQRRAKEKILTKAITQSPGLLKDMLAKVKWGTQGVAGKKGVEKVAVQPGFKEAPPAKGAVKEAPKDVARPGERIRHRAPQKNVVPVEDQHIFEGRVGKTVKVHEVGDYGDLKKRPREPGLEMHHAPQKHPAKQIIPGYDPKKAPAIALTVKEHKKIPNVKGAYEDNPRQLLAKTARDLRNYTDTPNDQILKLLEDAKKQYPVIKKK